MVTPRPSNVGCAFNQSPTPTSSAVRPGSRDSVTDSGGRSGRLTVGSTGAIGVTSKLRSSCALLIGRASRYHDPRDSEAI